MGEHITGISSMATRQVLAELVADYQRLLERTVIIESVGGVAAARRVADGEPFDIVVLASDAIDRLAGDGLVDPQSCAGLARSGVAIAIAAGAPAPDIATEAALRDAVLTARTIGYSTGPSGTHLGRLFERWGIAEIIASRVVQAPPGVPVGSLVASGQVELGFQQLSEMMHLPGIQVIGGLPPDVQIVTVFSAAVGAASRQKEAARELIAFLASPKADPIKRRHGMEAVREDRK